LIADLSTKVQTLLNQNASAILTATGVVGTVGTAVLTGRATFKAAEIIQRETEKRQDDPESDRFAVQRMEVVQMVWPLYLPPIALGGGTIAAIIMANRISAKRAAALAAAYSISERQFTEYKDKALEKLGVAKESKLRDEIAQERVTNNPNREVIIIGSGDVLFYDMLTGRYFESSAEKVNKALAKVHSSIYNYMHCSLTEFFDELGLPPTDYTEMVGWNSETVPKVEFSTTVTPDERPCMTMALFPQPKPDYDYRPY